MRSTDFDYELPPGLIAAAPMEPRDQARLLVFDRSSGSVQHSRVRDLPHFLDAADVLVVNDTRVRPWRLRGRRASGGSVEVLLVARAGDRWQGLVKPARKLRLGEAVELESAALSMTPLDDLGGGRFELALAAPGGDDLEAVLERVGRAPLPPYVRRTGPEDVARDRADYQTVFAAAPGAIAAPTAGLHFTPALLGALAERGIEVAKVTLHVGEGTFAPVRAEEVEGHRMHAEEYVLPEQATAAVARARARGGRVVAVGTTSARVLESCAGADGSLAAGRGITELFLYPGKPFRVVSALLTNFHLPRSTLLMLVAAFVGRDVILDLYRQAVAARYRFYSFGDAMLLL
jgi:S-adenosylmethionine:tRNA ribosyltransferase-isomerase